MPHAHPRALADRDAVKTLSQNEQAGQDLRQGKVRPQRLLRHLESALLQPFAEERQVPGIELAARKLFEIRKFLARGRPAAARQVVEKREHLFAALRHAGGQRVVGEVLEAEQLCELVTQRQYLCDDGIVVEAPRARAQLGAARDPRLVNVAPQLRALGAGHDRHIGGLVELEQPSRPGSPRARPRRLDRARSPAALRARRRRSRCGCRRGRHRARSPKTSSPVGRAAA